MSVRIEEGHTIVWPNLEKFLVVTNRAPEQIAALVALVESTRFSHIKESAFMGIHPEHKTPAMILRWTDRLGINRVSEIGADGEVTDL